jgi:hypothetical protein
VNSYIFITNEGFTYQPNSESIEPDIENCQVIGFSYGKNPQKAFRKLVEDSEYLKKTNFDEIFCLQLVDGKKSYFSLKGYKR